MITTYNCKKIRNIRKPEDNDEKKQKDWTRKSTKKNINGNCVHLYIYTFIPFIHNMVKVGQSSGILL